MASSSNTLPIFVISFDRGDYLMSVFESYRKQDIRTEVVVHDNGSTEPRTVEVLSQLIAAGTKVYSYAQISSPEELDGVDISLDRYRAATGYDGPYAVTDCDIDLSPARPDALRTYLRLLDLFDDVECVGPMLRISDIPRSYPLFNRVMARHIEQFWGRQPEWVEMKMGRVAYLKHAIDTTFAIHRAGSNFRRLKSGLRVYHPFEARHLDWYVSPNCADRYRATSSAAISHWNNDIEFAKYGSLPDTVLDYKVVEGELGNLDTVVRSTLDNPD